MSTEEKPLHVRQAEGLRALADMVEASPEIAPLGEYCMQTLYVFSARSAEDHAMVTRAALRHGAKVDKDIGEELYNLSLSFAGGAVVAKVLANRSDVCERVVTGTETVTKTVPDPERLAEVPTVEVTETVEHVEWVCRPLLAAEADAAVTA